MTACAPGTSARRRSTVSIGNRPLTFGVTSTTPLSAAWVSDGPNAVERASELGFEYQRPEHHRHPHRDADHAEQCPAPVGDQRGEVDPPERQPSGAQPCASPLRDGRGGVDGARTPVDKVQLAGAVARRGLVVGHHDDRRAVFV